jgi:hypothetical protein
MFGLGTAELAILALIALFIFGVPIAAIVLIVLMLRKKK